MNRLAPDIHHRHRPFRADARHVAPDKLVEHHVAIDDDETLARAAQDFVGALFRQLIHKRLSVVSSPLSVAKAETTDNGLLTTDDSLNRRRHALDLHAADAFGLVELCA